MRKRRIFAGAFAASLIAIAGLCGFAAVDLSTEKYMPGQFGVFLALRVTPGEEISVTLLGKQYALRAEDLEAPLKLLEDYRGLLPVSPRVARALTGQAVRVIAETLNNSERPRPSGA